MRGMIAGAMLVTLSLGLLYHLLGLFFLGYYVVREPNRLVIAVEIAGLVAVVALGLDRFISAFGRTRRKYREP